MKFLDILGNELDFDKYENLGNNAISKKLWRDEDNLGGSILGDLRTSDAKVIKTPFLQTLRKYGLNPVVGFFQFVLQGSGKGNWNY